MPKTEAEEFRVEVDPNNSNMVWVRGVRVNPNQSPLEAMEDLPYNNPDVARLTQEMWGGDEEERAKLAELGITSETKVDIPIWFKRQRFSTDEGRKAFLDNKLGYGLPYCLDSLKDTEIRKALQDQGIWWVVALGQSNKKLLQLEDYSSPVSLRLGGGGLGFFLGFAEHGWHDNDAVVGSPILSQ